MNKAVMFVVLFLMVVLVGCATGTNYGYSRGWGSTRMIDYADPTLPVNSGVVANAGINGPSGPYAAALGLGSISDENARRDAMTAMNEISRNQYGYGGVGVYNGGSRGFNARPGILTRGIVTNRAKYARWVSVDGSQMVMIPANNYAWFIARSGTATVQTFDGPQGQMVRSDSKDIDEVRDDRKCPIPSGGVMDCDWFYEVTY